jgi:ABC-type antimicrobial peptide transport system permease subunit
MILPIGEYELFFSSRCFLPLYDFNLTTSQIKWVNQTIEDMGNLTLTFENQFYQNIDDALVILQNDYYQYETKVFTNANGKITLKNLPWGTFWISIIHDDFSLTKQVIELNSPELELTLVIDTEGPLAGVGNIAYWQDRSFSVVWSSEFVSGFLDTTLSLITTTLTTLVIIVSVLSLLSITSVISHPIVANKRTILTFQYLGANRQQIAFAIVSQLVLLGFLASVIGAVLGMWGMTLLPQFQHINIGGVIIQPQVDIWLLLAIFLSNISVIAIKAAQKVNEVFTSHLPGNSH